jgi:hypothetical protein
MAALGNVTKDAEGRFQIQDDPEKDESDELKAAFNREIARRGASIGHGGDQDDNNTRMHRPPPTNPSRDTDFDYDDDDHQPQPAYQPAQQRTRAPPRPNPRADNLDNPAMADAYESLRNISRNATGEDAKDDEMMASLLDRMGGTDV